MTKCSLLLKQEDIRYTPTAWLRQNLHFTCS